VRSEWVRIVIMADDDNFSLDTNLDNVCLLLRKYSVIII